MLHLNTKRLCFVDNSFPDNVFILQEDIQHIDDVCKKTLLHPLNLTKEEVQQYVYDSVVPEDFHNVLFDIIMQNGMEMEPFNILVGQHFTHFLEHRGPDALKVLLH